MRKPLPGVLAPLKTEAKRSWVCLNLHLTRKMTRGCHQAERKGVVISRSIGRKETTPRDRETSRTAEK